MMSKARQMVFYIKKKITAWKSITVHAAFLVFTSVIQFLPLFLQQDIMTQQ